MIKSKKLFDNLKRISIISIIPLICFILLPTPITNAQEIIMGEEVPSDYVAEIETIETTFWAEVVEVRDQKVENNDQYYQDLILRGKDKEFKNKEYEYLGLTNNISGKNLYEEGDTVLVSLSKTGEDEFISITDKSRLPSLYFLFFIFVAVVILVAKKHGLRALGSLALTLLVILGYVVPQILKGAEPIRTVVFSSVIIVIVSMVLVYGWNKKSLISISGMLVGIFITYILSSWFSSWASLSGNSVEEVMFIKNYVQTEINFRGLLLASFIVGALGVPDDVAITQVSTVIEISDANKALTSKEIFKKSMNVGTDHIASMINTLFLAYAGASFVLLLLFGLHETPFKTVATILNNELVATEIIRTLVGSIGLILTVPITTYLASYYFKEKQK